MNRRAFLRSGAVAGSCAVLVSGCDDPAATKVETPPVPKGNRSKLEALKGKGPAPGEPAKKP